MKTYPEMNDKIVELLKVDGSPMTTYAAYRIQELEAELAKTREQRDGWKEGTEEACEQFKARVAELETASTHLRECLKRLEWCVFPDTMGNEALFCPACGLAKDGGHSPDCWLRRELEGVCPEK